MVSLSPQGIPGAARGDRRGTGAHWWCVVFPLCTAAASDWEETAIACGMEEEDVSLMAGEAGYVLKFRSLELWESLRQRLDCKVLLLYLYSIYKEIRMS